MPDYRSRGQGEGLVSRARTVLPLPRRPPMSAAPQAHRTHTFAKRPSAGQNLKWRTAKVHGLREEEVFVDPWVGSREPDEVSPPVMMLHWHRPLGLDLSEDQRYVRGPSSCQSGKGDSEKPSRALARSRCRRPSGR